MEGRDDDAEQIKATMHKKLKSLTQQLEELHEEKQAAVKVRVGFVSWEAFEISPFEGNPARPENVLIATMAQWTLDNKAQRYFHSSV